MTPAELLAQKRLEAESLIRTHAPTRLQDALIDLLRPAIALSATRFVDEAISVGASKFGGAPDVPDGFVWPTWNEKPLGFLAQVNLEEVAPFDVEKQLPQSGVLSFFYALEDPVWGEAHQRDGWRVFFFENQTLTRVAADSSHFTPRSMMPKPFWSIPMDSELHPEMETDLDVLIEEEEEMEIFHDEFFDDVYYQMLGYANVVQREPGLECEKWALPKTAASEWILLLQFSCDAGTLYFMTRREDLASKSLEQTWLILQSG